MGIKKFFKKIFGEEVPEKKEEVKKISLSEVDDLLHKKENELREDKIKTIEIVKLEISDAIKELGEKIENLDKVDVDSIKSPEKVKLVVKENLKKYVEDVEKFKVNLLNLSEEKNKNLSDFFSDLDSAFLNFDKKSRINYEKATILVGKEVAQIRETLKKLYKQIKDIFEENKYVISKLDSIHLVSENHRKIKKADNFVSSLKKKENALSEEIKNIEGENEKIFEEIEEFKKSEKYSEILKKKEMVESLKSELDRGIYSLKDMIDFKYLGNIFHVNEKKMEVLKEHKEKFSDCFYKNLCAELIRLIKETNYENKEKIVEKLDELKGKHSKIKEIEKSIGSDFIKNMSEKIERNKLKVKDIEKEKEKIQKNIDKVVERREEIFNELKNECKKLNFSVKED